MREVLRHRNFRLLLVGQTLSMFGDTALFMTLAVWTKQLTGSSGAAGAVFLALGLPYLLAPLGGLLVDRVRRRPLMITVDLLTGAAVLLLLLVHDRRDVWLIYLVAVLYGTSLLVFQSARSALVFTLLPDELLDAGNSALTTVREGLRLLGPLAGVALYARFGGSATATLDAVSFVASALALLRIRLREDRPTPRDHSIVAELAAGARHLAGTPVLRRLVVALVATMGVFGLSETLIFPIVEHGLHRPPTFLGVWSVLMGTGAVGGGLTATALSRRFGDTRLVGLGLFVSAVAALLLAGSGLASVGTGAVLFGLGLPWVVIGFNTALQRGTPGSLQGRAYSAADTMLTVPQLASIAAGALLVDIVDYRWLLVVMAAVLAGAAASLANVRASVAPQPQQGATGAATDPPTGQNESVPLEPDAAPA